MKSKALSVLIFSLMATIALLFLRASYPPPVQPEPIKPVDLVKKADEAPKINVPEIKELVEDSSTAEFKVTGQSVTVTLKGKPAVAYVTQSTGGNPVFYLKRLSAVEPKQTLGENDGQ